jgi:hypothetical protein
VKVDDKIELVYDPSITQLGIKETELQKEQERKYKLLIDSLNDLEKTVGVWNPTLCYSTVQQALDQLCEKTDILDSKQAVDFIGTKGKELNKELDSLVSRFK